MPGQVLGRGGEAKVCAVSLSRVAKLHHARVLADGKRAVLQLKVSKLRALSATTAVTQAGLANVVWPEASLFDDHGHFCGYVMRRVDGKTLHSILGDHAWNLRERVSIASQLARTFQGLHALGLAVGDPSANNVLVARSPGGVTAYVIDADSFQLPCFPPCRLASPRYQLPKVQARKAPFAPGREADEHALAFLSFELLLGGISPYAHKNGESPQENAAKEFFALAVQDSLVTDGPWLVRWQALPQQLRDLFTRAFVPSCGPKPTASEWVALLSSISVPSLWPDLQVKVPVVPAATAAYSTTPRRLIDRVLFWRNSA